MRWFGTGDQHDQVSPPYRETVPKIRATVWSSETSLMVNSKMPLLGTTSTAAKLKDSAMACLLASLLSTGCSIELKEKAPNASSTETTWLVHCETAESHRPNDEQINKGVSKPHWLVALTPHGAPYRLKGTLEDGFLAVDEMQPSEEDLRLGCISALELSKR